MNLNAHQRNLLTRAAWDKLHEAGEKNVVAIGFGTALKTHIPDLARPSVMRFYVRRKDKRKHKLEIREKLSLTIADSSHRSGRSRQRIVVATDVYELPRMVAAGRNTYLLESSRVTSGLVVRWQESGAEGSLSASSAIKFGVVTVAHPFAGQSASRHVFIESFDIAIPIVGSRRCQSNPSADGIDVCLLEIRVEDGIRAGIIRDPNAPSMAYKSFHDLVDDQEKVGASLQAHRTVSYTVAGTLDAASIEGVGPRVMNLLHIQGGYGAFEKGTSGSILNVFEPTSGGMLMPSAIQVGADAATFSLALGQSLETALVWLKRQFAIQLISEGRGLVRGELTPISIF